MQEQVTKRFIKLSVAALVVVGVGWLFFDHFMVSPAPGDFEVRAGNIHLDIKEFDKALEDYNIALERARDHRGALMGRALAFHLSKRHGQAERAYDYLIKYMKRNLDPDDPTGKAVLAGAYANRGIMKDQIGRHEDALKDYIEALKTDPGAVEGPGVVDKILYIVDPSSVRKRAEYLVKQFNLPKEKRVFLVPEIDAKQRMHKP